MELGKGNRKDVEGDCSSAYKKGKELFMQLEGSATFPVWCSGGLLPFAYVLLLQVEWALYILWLETNVVMYINIDVIKMEIYKSS